MNISLRRKLEAKLSYHGLRKHKVLNVQQSHQPVVSTSHDVVSHGIPVGAVDNLVVERSLKEYNNSQHWCYSHKPAQIEPVQVFHEFH